MKSHFYVSIWCYFNAAYMLKAQGAQMFKHVTFPVELL